MNIPPIASLKKRYFSKLIANVVSIPLNVLLQALIPRALGPAGYGDFSYLSNFFTQVVTFLDSGTSVGFYTKLSQRPKEKELIFFYFCFIAFVSVVLFCLTGFVFLVDGNTILWPHQINYHIWLAVIWGILLWISQVAMKIVDAFGLTTLGEIVKLFQKIITVLIFIGLMWYTVVDLSMFFYFQSFALILLISVLWTVVVKKSNILLNLKSRLTFNELRKYSLEFYDYSMPLLIYSGAGLIVGIFDRWILQKYFGSVEQGYFGLSNQVSALCFVFTGAMTPLFMREFSIAFNENNKEKMKHLFDRHIPMLYSVAGAISVFISINAQHISVIVGGQKFARAALPVSIMALYPIHQTYGQLYGSIFYATGQTKIYRNVGLFTMFLGLVCSYFFIAPKSQFGLELGAEGLALKMIVVQFISVNIQLIINTKFLSISWKKYFFHQFYVLILFFIIAFLSNAMTNLYIDNIIVRFTANLFFYGVGIVLMFFLSPGIFSMTRIEVLNIIHKILNWKA